MIDVDLRARRRLFYFCQLRIRLLPIGIRERIVPPAFLALAAALAASASIAVIFAALQTLAAFRTVASTVLGNFFRYRHSKVPRSQKQIVLRVAGNGCLWSKRTLVAKRSSSQCDFVAERNFPARTRLWGEPSLARCSTTRNFSRITKQSPVPRRSGCQE